MLPTLASKVWGAEWLTRYEDNGLIYCGRENVRL
jgi:hypothetical protein